MARVSLVHTSPGDLKELTLLFVGRVVARRDPCDPLSYGICHQVFGISRISRRGDQHPVGQEAAEIILIHLIRQILLCLHTLIGFVSALIKGQRSIYILQLGFFMRPQRFVELLTVIVSHHVLKIITTVLLTGRLSRIPFQEFRTLVSHEYHYGSHLVAFPVLHRRKIHRCPIRISVKEIHVVCTSVSYHVSVALEPVPVTFRCDYHSVLVRVHAAACGLMSRSVPGFHHSSFGEYDLVGKRYVPGALDHDTESRAEIECTFPYLLRYLL